MMKKLAMFLVFVMCLSAAGAQPAMASSGLKEGASSLLIPGWGQYQNGEFQTTSGRVKSGFMIMLEIAAIATTATVGGVAGYPVVWVGISLFLANHIWSSVDAFLNAEKEPGVHVGTSAAHDQTGAK